MRKTARDNAFKLIFEGLINDGCTITYRLITERAEPDDKTYIETVWSGIRARRPFLLSVIGRFAAGFAVERIYKVDLAILLLAVEEILFMDAIPVKVSANEAVMLAKTYSGDNSPGFINGILASVIRDRDVLIQEFQAKEQNDAGEIN